MPEILERLTALAPSIRVSGQPADINQLVNEQLDHIPIDHYRQLVLNHLTLRLAYSALCLAIRRKFEGRDTLPPLAKQDVELLLKALIMADVLWHVYHDYLNVPREANRMQSDRNSYCRLLNKMKLGFDFNEKNQDTSESFRLIGWPGHDIRNTMPDWNFPRLLIGRLRRLVITLIGLEAYQFLQHYLDIVEPILRPCVAHAAYIAFIPRLTINMGILLKHLIPCDWWMSQEEQDLGWRVRLHAQLQRRWFELGNDAFWFMSGLLNCFVLTGPLAPIAIYLSITLFFYDMIAVQIRAYFDYKRFNELQQPYANKLNAPSVDSYEDALNARIRFEQDALLGPLYNTRLLLLGMCFTHPYFQATPLYPVIGALIVLITTIVNIWYFYKMRKKRPADPLPQEFISLANSENPLSPPSWANRITQGLGFFQSEAMPPEATTYQRSIYH